MTTIKSSTRRVRGLARHLLRVNTNESVEIGESRGLLPEPLGQMLEDLDGLAVGTNTDLPVIHVSINPSRSLSDVEWANAWAIYEDEFDLTDQPFTTVKHTKYGREHQHRAYGRIREEDGTVVRDNWSWLRNEKVSRTIEFELRERLTIGRHNRAVSARLVREGRADIAVWMKSGGADRSSRPAAKLHHWEQQQAERTKTSPAELRAAIYGAWIGADTPDARRSAFLAANLNLALGDKGTPVVVDRLGGIHPIRRAINAHLKANGLGEPLTARAIRTGLAGLELKPIEAARRTLAAVSVDAATISSSPSSFAVPVTDAVGVPNDQVINAKEKAMYQERCEKALEELDVVNRRYDEAVRRQAAANQLAIARKVEIDQQTALIGELEAALDRSQAEIQRISAQLAEERKLREGTLGTLRKLLDWGRRKFGIELLEDKFERQLDDAIDNFKRARIALKAAATEFAAVPSARTPVSSPAASVKDIGQELADIQSQLDARDRAWNDPNGPVAIAYARLRKHVRDTAHKVFADDPDKFVKMVTVLIDKPETLHPAKYRSLESFEQTFRTTPERFGKLKDRDPHTPAPIDELIHRAREAAKTFQIVRHVAELRLARVKTFDEMPITMRLELIHHDAIADRSMMIEWARCASRIASHDDRLEFLTRARIVIGGSPPIVEQNEVRSR